MANGDPDRAAARPANDGELADTESLAAPTTAKAGNGDHDADTVADGDADGETLGDDARDRDTDRDLDTEFVSDRVKNSEGDADSDADCANALRGARESSAATRKAPSAMVSRSARAQGKEKPQQAETTHA